MNRHCLATGLAFSFLVCSPGVARAQDADQTTEVRRFAVALRPEPSLMKLPGLSPEAGLYEKIPSYQSSISTIVEPTVEFRTYRSTQTP
jgi:hypothetical protein